MYSCVITDVLGHNASIKPSIAMGISSDPNYTKCHTLHLDVAPFKLLELVSCLMPNRTVPDKLNQALTSSPTSARPISSRSTTTAKPKSSVAFVAHRDSRILLPHISDISEHRCHRHCNAASYCGRLIVYHVTLVGLSSHAADQREQ